MMNFVFGYKKNWLEQHQKMTTWPAPTAKTQEKSGIIFVAYARTAGSLFLYAIVAVYYVGGDGADAAEALQVYFYNQGYMAGHDDTVECCFTDIHHSDMTTYHADIVAELLQEQTQVTDFNLMTSHRSQNHDQNN